MTIIHGTRKVRLFTKSTHEVTVGYYLVLSNGDRHWFGASVYDAARALDRACDKYLNDKNGWWWWVDYCYGYDVKGNLAWANIDQSEIILHRAENL